MTFREASEQAMAIVVGPEAEASCREKRHADSDRRDPKGAAESYRIVIPGKEQECIDLMVKAGLALMVGRRDRFGEFLLKAYKLTIAGTAANQIPLGHK